MKVSATRENLLAPLQSVMGVVERRQTMPILANVLLSARNDKLSVTGTDLEVELVAAHAVSVQQAGDVTLTRDGEKVVIKAGRSRFTLSSLPATEFPVIEDINARQALRITRAAAR